MRVHAGSPALLQLQLPGHLSWLAACRCALVGPAVCACHLLNQLSWQQTWHQLLQYWQVDSSAVRQEREQQACWQRWQHAWPSFAAQLAAPATPAAAAAAAQLRLQVLPPVAP